MRSGRIGAISLAALASTLGACNSAADISNSRHAIEMFHFELDQAQYAQIWKSTSSEMRATTAEPALNGLFAAVHSKLGKVAESKEMGWNVNYNTDGTFTTVIMKTRFEHGTGDENFLFKSSDTGPQLAGYHINSMDLITH
jgi:hypothetical protein